MNFVNYNELEPIKNANGFKAFKNKTNFNTEVVKITLEPGAEVPTHKTPVDVIFYVLKGTVTIEIGEKKMEYTSNTLIESPKNIPHSLKNNQDEVMEILVIKLFT